MLVQPFRIHVPDDTLTDMFDRLARTRYVPTLGTVDRPGGLGGERLRALVDRWLRFDWRAEEARLNVFEHYTAEVNGHRLHFARLRPQRKAKHTVPLLLLHGWPSAFTGSSHLSGEQRVRMRGGEGRSGQVTPPVWRSTRSL